MTREEFVNYTLNSTLNENKYI